MIRPYNAHVLIGNWYEDRVLEEDVIKDFLDRKSQNGLLSQKSAQLTAANSQPVSLTTVPDGSIHFGDIVQIRCDGTNPTKMQYIAKATRKDCYLTGNFTGAGQENTLSSNGTTNGEINPKTAFIIRSVDGSTDGTVVRFGQPFALSSFCKRFFLHSDTRSYSKAARHSRLQETEFVDVYNHECDFVATCLNPKFRLEIEGTPIPANDKILILHMKSNKALGVVTDMRNAASFEIVCHTFLDSHKAEEDVNHWRLLTNVPQIPH